MRDLFDDNAKKRLTDRRQLAAAADLLLSRGFTCDDVAVQLARYYYVDIDLLNEVLSHDAEPEILRHPLQELWKDVA